MAESTDIDNEADDIFLTSNAGTSRTKKRLVYARDPEIKRRNATLYDVVDGRFASNGFIDKNSDAIRKNPIREKGISPDEYFASRRQSRERSQERQKTKESNVERRKPRRRALDAFSKVDLDPGSIDDLERMGLADSDLLKQLHAFAADYYAIQPDAKYMYRMMDASALMAMGLLIQEHQRFLTRDIATIYAETEDTVPSRSGETSEHEQSSSRGTESMMEDDAE